MAADSGNNRNRTPQRYGRGMIVMAWIALLGLIYVFFGNLLSDFNNPNQAPETTFSESGTAQIVLLRNRYGHYVANGHINQQAVEFLLDTGASSISIPAGVARRLQLHAGTPFQVRTASDIVTVYHTQLNSVSIGELHLYDIAGHINPHMPGESVLLGMSFLKHVDFTQKGKELIIRQRAQP